MRTSGEGSADLSLLTAHLRPERRQLLGLLGVLLVAMLLPVAGPVLLGNVVDAALAGRPTGVLLRGAVAFLVVTLFADGLQLALTRWLSLIHI